MPPDQNTTKNPISEENSIPASPQEPTEPAPENTGISAPAEALPEAPESSPSDFEVKSNNIPPSDSSLTEQENEQKTEENPSEKEPEIEPISEPKQEVSESQTAQMAGNEPLGEKEEKPKLSYLKSQKLKELLEKAKNVIQFRKRKKLDKIMSLFLEKSKITNDEVEKLLHVSDATATRYLSQLEKEGKVKQNSKTGKGVSYSRI